MSDFKIEDITICLHCGTDQKIVDYHIESLSELSNEYNITWNKRIDRWPYAYPSYSHLINHSIATSKDEFIIFVNDRCFPTAAEARKMLKHLEEGHAASFLWNVAYMAFSKELIRKLGWWDERFLNGGWEDRDWMMRIAEANLSMYESQESNYDFSWKSPLQHNDRCALSGPHFESKWQITSSSLKRCIKEEVYTHWDKTLGDERPDISNSWKDWSNSMLAVSGFDKPNSGPPGSSYIIGRNFIK